MWWVECRRSLVRCNRFFANYVEVLAGLLMCPGAKIFVASSADEKVTAVFAEKETEL